jgi:hypothetical protein
MTSLLIAGRQSLLPDEVVRVELGQLRYAVAVAAELNVGHAVAILGAWIGRPRG